MIDKYCPNLPISGARFDLRSNLAALACPLLILSAAAFTPGTSHHDAKPPSAKPSASPPDSKNGTLSLTDAMDRLKVAREARAGYERDTFGLWTDADHDGCDTCWESLLAEAVKKPRQGKSCQLTGGTWRSYYDDKTVTDACKLDIDHVVPLAEAWDFGASKWSAQRREQYANDLSAERSLVAAAWGAQPGQGRQGPGRVDATGQGRHLHLRHRLDRRKAPLEADRRPRRGQSPARSRRGLQGRWRSRLQCRTPRLQSHH
ncbi:GmrSD restriction endonuclease domain-containing protein [Streptomyces tubercidicus]